MNRTLFGLLGLAVFLLGACKKNTSDSSSAPVAGPSTKTEVAELKYPPLVGIRDASNLHLIVKNEEDERYLVKSNVLAMTMNGEFEKLEAMATEWRGQKTRFRNGAWRLASFYLAFADWPQNFSESQVQKLTEQCAAWTNRFPQSPTPRIALADIYRANAWRARGSGVASTVTEEGWKLMRERLQSAFKILAEADELPTKCPGWHSANIRVSLGSEEPRAEYEKRFARAVREAPDYVSIYWSKAYYLLPRWYGSQGEWESFCMEMMDRSDIPNSKEIFARAVIYFRRNGLFYDEFSRSDRSWKRLKESFKALVKNSPESLETKSIFCLISAQMGDYKEAREQMKLLENRVDLTVWEGRDLYVQVAEWLKKEDTVIEKELAENEAKRAGQRATGP